MINWSNFEGFFKTGIPNVVLYPSLVLVVILIAVILLSRKIKNKTRYIIEVLFVEYLFIVICSTIICRGPQSFEYARLELTPFWTYRAVLDSVPGVSVWDIILNVLLFIPLGFFTKILFRNTSLIKMIIIAVMCSVFIETNQYVFEKGIAQIDDVMHNILGGVLGWIIARAIIGLNRKLKIVRD